MSFVLAVVLALLVVVLTCAALLGLDGDEW